ncbi:MAG: HAMP domain-containing histidine kinase [Oligoflexia bacterium]|nr:HAMP domain-containing histidine kinase [Oligoflexia bacterium]
MRERVFNLLVIDDENGIRAGITRVLENHRIKFIDFDTILSFKIYSAASLGDSEKIILQENFSFYIIDYLLPDGNGIQFLNLLNERVNNTYLAIMISAHGELPLVVNAAKCGAFDFIVKPFGPNEIRSAVYKAAEYFLLLERNKEFEADKKRIRYEFISILAHELKSPINAIESYLNIMEGHLQGELINNYQRPIVRSKTRIQEMRKLINDLLDLTKIESNCRERNIEEINLCEVMHNCLESYQPLAKQKNIRINYQIDEKLLINANRSEIEMLVNNLISNAVKYNKDNGTVDFTASIQGKKLNIIIVDSGIGIAKDEKNKLFLEFSRIKNENTKNISGSGLGLSIVKKIVDQYHGSIEVESEVDRGTKFFISLTIV